MMFITGTIRNSVGLAELDGKWQLKKSELSSGKKQNMTAEEREQQLLQQQADDIREGRKPADIDAKLQSGAKLTQEEIDYLKKNNPQALKEYEDAQKEREGYKRQLKSCKSKEEVEKLKTTKMGQFMAAAKSIANDPYIPKGKKCQLMKKLLMQAYGIEKEHQKFLKSSQYINLPDEEQDARKRKKSDETVQEAHQEAASDRDAFQGEAAVDAVDEIRKMVSEIAPTGSRIDTAIGEGFEGDSIDMPEAEMTSRDSGIDVHI
ncbi:MAG: hypothetical protein K2N01_11790 [Lachnospiraceae bacterium]|nr:hypothetical protein [Lachnospiraceae bacterium]